jgi:hypothetical protein
VILFAFMGASLSIAASAVAAASLGYRGVADLILEEQLSPLQIVRLFRLSAIGVHGLRNGADRELAFVLLAAAATAPDADRGTIIALAERAWRGLCIASIQAEARKLVREHLAEIIDLACKDEAVAA